MESPKCPRKATTPVAARILTANHYRQEDQSQSLRQHFLVDPGLPFLGNPFRVALYTRSLSRGTLIAHIQMNPSPKARFQGSQSQKHHWFQRKSQVDHFLEDRFLEDPFLEDLFLERKEASSRMDSFPYNLKKNQ